MGCTSSAGATGVRHGHAEPESIPRSQWNSIDCDAMPPIGQRDIDLSVPLSDPDCKRPFWEDEYWGGASSMSSARGSAGACEWYTLEPRVGDDSPYLICSRTPGFQQQADEINGILSFGSCGGSVSDINSLELNSNVMRAALTMRPVDSNDSDDSFEKLARIGRSLSTARKEHSEKRKREKHEHVTKLEDLVALERLRKEMEMETAIHRRVSEEQTWSEAFMAARTSGEDSKSVLAGGPRVSRTPSTRRTPRKTSRETPCQTSCETPPETSRQTPRETPRQTLRGTPREPPRQDMRMRFCL